MAVYFYAMALAVTLSHPAHSQTIVYKAMGTSRDMLEDNSIYYSLQSKIECGSQCGRDLDYNNCAAFHFDSSSRTCTCGLFRSVGLLNVGPDVTLFTNLHCKFVEVKGVYRSLLFLFRSADPPTKWTGGYIGQLLRRCAGIKYMQSSNLDPIWKVQI